eukprot:6491843-Amphidinium_carterae.5
MSFVSNDSTSLCSWRGRSFTLMTFPATVSVVSKRGFHAADYRSDIKRALKCLGAFRWQYLGSFGNVVKPQDVCVYGDSRAVIRVVGKGCLRCGPGSLVFRVACRAVLWVVCSFSVCFFFDGCTDVFGCLGFRVVSRAVVRVVRKRRQSAGDSRAVIRVVGKGSLSYGLGSVVFRVVSRAVLWVVRSFRASTLGRAETLLKRSGFDLALLWGWFWSFSGFGRLVAGLRRLVLERVVGEGSLSQGLGGLAEATDKGLLGVSRALLRVVGKGGLSEGLAALLLRVVSRVRGWLWSDAGFARPVLSLISSPGG